MPFLSFLSRASITNMESTAPVQQSLLLWYYQSLGLMYSGLFLLSAIVGFFLTLLILFRGKGPMSVACLLLVVHWPFVIGVLGSADGFIAMLRVLSSSSAVPKPSEWAEGLSSGLTTIYVGSLLTTFLYFIAIPGTLIRSLSSTAVHCP